MAEAIRDQNRVPSWFGLSSVDGVTPVLIKVDSSTGRIAMEIGVSVSAVIASGGNNARRDNNFGPCLMGVSSTNSAVLIPLSVNPATGAVLAST